MTRMLTATLINQGSEEAWGRLLAYSVYIQRTSFDDQTCALWFRGEGEKPTNSLCDSPAELLRNNFHVCGWGPKRIARGNLAWSWITSSRCYMVLWMFFFRCCIFNGELCWYRQLSFLHPKLDPYWETQGPCLFSQDTYRRFLLEFVRLLTLLSDIYYQIFLVFIWSLLHIRVTFL